ncbi:MAG: type II secretion system protein GspD, partial [Bacteroidota bacterium]
VGAGGLTYVLTGVDVQATINASENSGMATVLSTPSILVLNNKEASINVGTRIPIQNNSINNSNNNTFSSIRYLQTGIKLTVTPRINPGGLVYIELSQEVSTPGIPDANNNRDIDNRELSTEIAVQSGETVVMGGLITVNNGRSSAGVPILNKIPLIGNLFGSKSKSSDRTELIVLLTPTVIDNPEQAKQLTKEYANQFKGLKPLKNKYDKYLKYTEKNENDE